jgi:anti-anti-sigma factor
MPSNELTITYGREGDAVVLKLSGRIDSRTAKAAGDALATAIADARPRLVIDLSGLSYVSSAGLRAMLSASGRIKQVGGKMALFGLTGTVREVFSVSGFDKILVVETGRSAALAAVRGD